ncbi:MAG TPA: hypothetical protein VMT55_01050, partial [Candidatus Sulfotelmatobacter sp.]|nr:hypothetical protein [Candidatus Sulfotelmatobacter sp.]
MHTQVEAACRDILRRTGGVELPNIEAEYLSADEFTPQIRRDLHLEKVPAGQQGTIESLSYASMDQGDLAVKLLYNVDALSTSRFPTSSLMVQLITGTIYGRLLEAMMRERGLFDDAATGNGFTRISHAITRAQAGWGQLLAQIPIGAERLILSEAGYFVREELSKAAKADILKKLRTGSNFTALALLKYEMAFGFERTKLLMKEVPGATASADGTDILRAFWTLYDQANRHFNTPSIPFEIFCEEEGPSASVP